MSFFSNLPSSVLQAGAIFLSIIIEALPFVLIGSIISGFIEVYVTPDKVYRFLPKNKWARIFFGSLIGIVFPSCECGIVPIINRFLERKFPVTQLCHFWLQLQSSTPSYSLRPTQPLVIPFEWLCFVL